ncbi:DUF397 domain-containing protein [Streptomyces sp. NPDC006984]|uniref:DUF397 domain-containing protein n=1 Tax=unclassified Streptomyces TaxID=2593676 RepID=UPI0033E806CE
MSNAHSPRPVRWVKSTYSGGDGGQCIEWALDQATTTGAVRVRDSKNPNGPQLTLTHGTFAQLVEIAKHAEL